MKKRRASTIVYLIFFYVVILAFCTFAVDATIIFNQRAKLQNATEAVALSTASLFGSTPAPTLVSLQNNATSLFNALSLDGLPAAQISTTAKIADKKILISTNVIARPFFLSFLGVSGVRLEAISAAKSEALPIKVNYAGISWLTTNAAYLSDIISKDVNLNDTAILLPLADFPSASYDNTAVLVKFDLLESADGHPLSLGPGGFVTIKTPAPIIDKSGYDLFVKEIGALEGYMVFAGLDVDPKNPYTQADKPGAGVRWIDITCSANPEVTESGTSNIKTYVVGGTNLDVAPSKIYGSASFDLGASCITGTISMAKYIRIIDDNQESALVSNSIGTMNATNYYKTMQYGEASGATSGADIDYVTVLNHVRLIKPSTY